MPWICDKCGKLSNEFYKIAGYWGEEDKIYCAQCFAEEMDRENTANEEGE